MLVLSLHLAGGHEEHFRRRIIALLDWYQHGFGIIERFGSDAGQFVDRAPGDRGVSGEQHRRMLREIFVEFGYPLQQVAGLVCVLSAVGEQYDQWIHNVGVLGWNDIVI